MKRVICITMAIILTVVPLSLCVSANATSGVLQQIIIDEIIEMVWNTLVGWGIQIGNTALDANQWLYNELNSYISEELNKTWDQWISFIQFSRDPWGRGVANNYFLETAWDFTEWLTNKYHWGNNDTYSYADNFVLNGITLYTLPIFLIVNDTGSGSYQGWTSLSETGTGTTYIAFYADSPAGYVRLNPVGISMSGTSTVITTNYHADGVAGSPSTTNIDSKSFTRQGPYNNKLINLGLSIRQVSNPGIEWYTADQLVAALASGGSPTPVDPLVVTTNVITLPDDSPEYQTGYSIIYYSDGTIGYIDIDWPSSISVDNLPATVSTSSATDPGFGQAFVPIKAFVSTFSDGMALVKDIAFRLPVQVWALFYAMMGITVIFGALHMFKEH